MPVTEVIFLTSQLTIIESTVVSSQFGKLRRNDRESVALIIIFLIGGVFLYPILLWLSREEGFKNLWWHIGNYTL